MNMIQIKRIYDPAEATDGQRILVDRIWPRGVTKEKAQIAAWMKEITPSPSLRTWFGHRPERFAEFKARYEAELSDETAHASLEKIRGWAASGTVTLLYAAKDRQFNHAVVLKEYLEQMPSSDDYFSKTPSI